MQECPRTAVFPAAPREGRRRFVGLLGGGLLGALLPGAARPGPARPRDERPALSYDEFLEEVRPIAKALAEDPSRRGADRYLLTLAAYAVRLLDVPVPELRDTTTDLKVTARTWIGANEGGDPFTVLHWKLDPGARIAQHAHTYGDVVTLCLEGSLRVANYEMVDGPDFARRGRFQVRRVRDQWLEPGDVNLVPLAHGYTHGFVAGPDGARGLDLTTRRGERQPTPLLVLAPEPLDAEQALYEAEWRFR